MSQITRKDEKEMIILNFLRCEGFSTRKLLGERLGVTRTSISRSLQRLKTRGLLLEVNRSHEDDHRSPALWGLTPTGAFEATDDGEYTHFDLNRVSEITLRHDLDVQRARIKAIHLGWIEWLGGRELRRKAVTERSTWLQVPDAFGVSPRGRKVALEIERRVKTPKRYEGIFSQYCQMLVDGTVQEVVYICPKRICPRLERLFLKIETMSVDGKIRPIHDSFRKRFHFVTYEGWGEYAKNF